MLLILFLLAHPAWATSITCYDANAVLVASNPSVLCVECDLCGHLTAPTVCNATCVVARESNTVQSICGTSFCLDDDGICAVSARGVRCRECGLAGFIENEQCQCYEKNCRLASNTTLRAIDRTDTTASCTPYYSRQLGFFKTLLECEEPYGPPPNQGLQGECNTLGGVDPQNPNDGFFTCSRHGDFDPNTHICTCHQGWTGPLCNQCAQDYGPYPVCGTIWTPDPVDGVLKECSGHGTQFNGVCQCFFNSSAGFWVLAPFRNVETCIGCDYDFPSPGCIHFSQSPSSAPFLETDLPSASPMA
jgi:hypothetical protein